MRTIWLNTKRLISYSLVHSVSVDLDLHVNLTGTSVARLSGSYVYCYAFRFLGIQEQPFSAFNWVNPAEADWMDLNIPEHRIEYFKYDDKIVWEKKSRIDNVFGSTGNWLQIIKIEPLACHSSNGDILFSYLQLF